MKVAVIGSGGREHALAWRLSLSPFASEIGVFPGNPGIGIFDQEGISIKSYPVEMSAPHDWKDLKQALQSFGAELVFVGPDNPLVEGIVDSLEKSSFRVFGPSKRASRLEGSKSFGKKVAQLAGIPTAKAKTFESFEAAEAFLGKQSEEKGIVVKADGLALGKGVTVCNSKDEAKDALKEIFLDKRFGTTNALIEERMEGQELSAFFLCKGSCVRYLGSACDYKRAYEGDLGPNTGGMGAISPFPDRIFGVDPEDLRLTLERFATQTMKVMGEEGSPFQGFLFLGLMLREDGGFKERPLDQRLHLIEYNVRMGDPECQSLMLRLDDDLLKNFCESGGDKSIAEWDNSRNFSAASPLKMKNQSVCTVVVASAGYPKKTQTGHQIQGLDKLSSNLRFKIFFAGVQSARPQGSNLLNSGGRVFSVSALGENLQEAQQVVYEAIEKLEFNGMWYRKDIARSFLDRSKE
jgi:phosphoribosylamine--glycine ligase